MEKARTSKFAHYADKLAVSSEPGLTNAQLMLTNFDLKPGMSCSTHRRGFHRSDVLDSGARTSAMGCLELRGVLDR